MEIGRFNEIVTARLQKVKDTLTLKADEYARGDRLSNFKQIAGLGGCTPEKALTQLVAKHIVALYDFINDLDKDIHQLYSRWDEKIGDIIAYMALLDALLQERFDLTEQTLKH
jgi:hypothetical protein